MSAYLEYFKERVPWARDMNDMDIVSHMSKVTGKPIQAVAEEFGVTTGKGKSAITAGFSSGVDSLQGLGYSAIAAGADALGFEGARDWAQTRADRNEVEAQIAGREDLERVEDVWDKPGQWGPYLAYQVAKQVPQIGGAAALGLVAPQAAVPAAVTRGAAMLPRVLGGGGLRAGASFAERRAALEAGNMFGRQALAGSGVGTVMGAGDLYGETVDAGSPDPYTALGLAPVYGLMDSVPQAVLAGTIAKPAFKGALPTRIAKSAGVNMLTGAAGEAGQTELGIALNPTLTEEEKFSRRLNAVVAGGLAEGTFGSVGGFRSAQPTNLLPGSNPPPTPTSETLPQQPLGLPFYANEPMVVFPDGTTMTAAEARQQRADGFTYSGQPPVTQAPAPQAPTTVSEKTPFFEPPLVSTIPGASTLPVLGPQPQVITGENPNAQLILPQTDPVQAFQQAYEKQQRGELLTQSDLLALNNPPQGIQLPQAAPQGPTVRREPTQGELFNDTPLRSAYDVATRGMPPVAPQGPVLTNEQNPNQLEMFVPDGQPWTVGQEQRRGQAGMSGLVPSYAATQGVPDVAGAAAETSRAVGIPASRPGSATGTKRQQLLERIEKARMEGRFVGREEQYDDLVNDLTVNAFGRVEKGIAEVEKAPLQPAPQAGASPLAAPGARTLQEVDAEMDAMRVNGRAPQGGVAREAWNDLQRERDALAAQVGAPPRPKYVPPQKAAPKKEEPKKEPPKKEPPKKEAPKKEPPKKEGPKKPEPKKEPPKKEAPKKPEPPKKEEPKKEPPKKEAPAPLKETTAERWNAMEDRVTYEDLTPEVRDAADEANKTGDLTPAVIDTLVEQNERNKRAAKRSTQPTRQEETDLDEPSAEQVNKVVQTLPQESITALEQHYGVSYGEDVAAFIDKVTEDVVTAVNFGINKIDAAIRKIIKSIANGVMSVAVVFNPMALQTPADFALPQKYTYTVETRVEIKANVPAEARANMSPTAQRVYEAVATQATSTGKGFMIADKQNGMLHAFGPNGVIISQSPALYGKDVGDTMQKTGNQWNRVTPAGKYTLTVENDSTYAGGKVFSLVETNVPGEGVVAVHAVYLGNPDENRLGRLASPTAQDNRISWGCVNTSNQAFLNELLPNANILEGGAIFVLPDSTSATEMFPVETRVDRETREERRTTAEKQTRAGTKGRKEGVDDVPPAVLARTEVEIDAYNPDTGRFEKTTVPADQAMDSLNEDKATFQNFVNCLKKGK